MLRALSRTSLPERLRLAANGACLALALGFAVAAPLRITGDRPEARLSMYPSAGEILTHGIPARMARVSDRLPLATVVSARVVYHTRARYGVLLAAYCVLAVLLIFAIGFLLHPWGGVVAALAVAVWSSKIKLDSSFYWNPDAGYFLVVLLAAGVLVWRARAPSPGRSACLAAAVGVTLLWRSPLAFFTPALALYEWAVEHRFSFKAYGREFVILCVVPYLFLLPWIAMNWSVHRELVVFERGAASSNIVTGALGLVQNIEGDIGTLIGGPIDVRNTGAVLGWAIGEVARHPIRFARAYILRMEFALTLLHPLLAPLAAASLWFFRKRREYRDLAFMAAYFFCIHCLMTVEERYFWPPLALLTLLACCLPAGLLGREPPREDAPDRRLASGLLKGSLAIIMVVVLYTQWLVLSFANAARRGQGSVSEQLGAALESNPDDAWLLEARGNDRFNRGDASGSAADFARAAARDPQYPRSELLLARAEAISGNLGRLLAWNAPTGAGREDIELRIEASILQACAYIRLGRTAEALERLAAGGSMNRALRVRVRGPQGEREKRVSETLRSSDSGFIGHCRRLQGPRPIAERMALFKALTGLLPDASEAWLERAGLEAATGSRKAALVSMARAEALHPGGSSRDGWQLRRIAFGYIKLHEHDQALRILTRLTREYPLNAEYSADLARSASLKAEYAGSSK